MQYLISSLFDFATYSYLRVACNDTTPQGVERYLQRVCDSGWLHIVKSVLQQAFEIVLYMTRERMLLPLLLSSQSLYRSLCSVVCICYDVYPSSHT